MVEQLSLVLVEKRNGAALVTMNRPEAMNALSSALRDELTATIDQLEADAETRVLILTGAGTRAFTAGLDLKELGSAGGAALEGGTGDPMRALLGFSGPTIAAVNGVAITGGFELALGCDVLIGTPNTRFADTHAREGILPAWGLSQRLSRILGPSRAKEISLTGNFIAAEEACAWGLINRIVPEDALIETAFGLADDMLSCIPEAVTAYKALIDDGYATNFGASLALEIDRTRDANREVQGASVEARRHAIQKRGQDAPKRDHSEA